MENFAGIIYDFIESKEQNQTSREMISFIEQIGATIVGIKPACLIGVYDKDCFAFCKKHFTGNSPVSFVIVSGKRGRKRLFIYHKKSLELLLSNVEIRCYLEKCGYPENSTSEAYVRLLARKLHGTEFPHEIGLFFGYPLKDVQGFMGEPIPYRKTMGWRMYGDTRVSEKVYYQHKNARLYVRNVMLQACQ